MQNSSSIDVVAQDGQLVPELLGLAKQYKTAERPPPLEACVATRNQKNGKGTVAYPSIAHPIISPNVQDGRLGFTGV